MTAEPVPAGTTSRTSAARVLVELAHELFDTPATGAPVAIDYREEPIGALEGERAEFLRTRLADCPPWLVTAATNRITWTDSDGVSNVAYSGSLGPVVPIVAREATLAWWHKLDADLAGRTVNDANRDLLAEVTTDKVPREILRSGVEAAARVLVQHAYLADRTPYADPASFAAVLRDSGIFTTVAGTWHWGLQASTYRRGLIPVQLICFGGRVTYSADSVAALRVMKDARIAAAHTTDNPDPSAEQYAALEAGEHPRCLAHPPQFFNGHRVSLLTALAAAYVDTFTRLLDVVTLTTSTPTETELSMSETSFEVPDMTCHHCVNTITKAVAEFGVEAPTFDLETKRVVATFPTPEIRDQSYSAIRAHGYTVVPSAAG
ncbi:cation transporter [Kribbella solani]|uniref:Copper chaperone CopZ n=1 Tax=Kribbella solani TaxID=236067 RepID=A0A841DJV6_9ACTN|nr:copper chaperone CopZ [Kribbella solani]